ncbi:MAG TPA: hypothetical protein VGI39_11445 [Polyangiaceae bacterium]|jgi:hypothetical protein
MSFDDKRSPNAPDSAASDLDRRSFLRILGIAFSTAVLPEVMTGCSEDGAEPFSVNTLEDLTVAKTINIVRPEDLLVLSIGLVNLKRSPAGALVKTATAAPAYVVLDFPPQAILEDAAPVAGTRPVIPQIFANAMMGGTSRLVFQLAANYTSVPYALSSILDLCGQSSLVVSAPLQGTVSSTVAPPSSVPTTNGLVEHTLASATAAVDPAASARRLAFNNALPVGLTAFPGTGTAQPPGLSDRSVTQLEIPFRVILSPNAMAGWKHASSPVQGSSGAYEVWHTTLGVRNADGSVDEKNSYLRTVRALWTRDLDSSIATCTGSPVNCPPPANGTASATPGPEGTTPIANPSLTPIERYKIVQLSSQTPNAPPIQVNRLMLSSLGGYLDARGDFNDSTYARWIHKMSGGRESYVEFDILGYLLPFGHKATRIQVTRRNDDPSVGPVGQLYAYDVIVIGSPTVSYRPSDTSAGAKTSLLQWPFVAVELKKTQFITLPAQIGKNAQGAAWDGKSYWPLDATGSPIMVPVVGYDRRGRAVQFSVPLYFALNSTAAGTALSNYQAALKSPPFASPRASAPPPLGVLPMGGTGTSLSVAMGGQRVAYADSRKDDTVYATRSMCVDLSLVSDPFQFAPFMTVAEVDIESLHQYLPHAADGSSVPVPVTYHSRFTTGGVAFDTSANKSQLLFRLLNTISADFTKDPAGGDRSDCGTGFVAPNMTFNAISRTTGPSYDGTLATASSAGMRPMGTFGDDGAFDPSKYLGLAGDALNKIKIFGVFSLTDIIKAVDPDEAKADLDGLAQSAEQAALKYAPKFVAEGLSEIEQVISLITELKSQVEYLYTNGQELLNSTLSNAENVVINNVNAAVSDVTGMVNDIISDAKLVYASLLSTINHIESFDVLTLAGTATQDGSILKLLTDLQTLEGAIDKLAKAAVRATVQAQQLATNAANAVSNQKLRQSKGMVPAGVLDPAMQMTNTAIQVAQGLQQTFSNKLAQLNSLLTAAGDIPAKVTQLFNDAQQALDTLKNMTVKIEWQPKVGSYALPNGWTIFRPATQHSLTLALEARAKATADKNAGVDVSCRLDHFDLCLGPLDDDKNPTVGLKFDHISFQMDAGKKPDVDVQMNGIVFGGILSFLETLRKIIPLDGFSDPPYLVVDVNGIHAGFSLSVPNVAVGMFSLENIAITAKLEIPFFSSGDAGSMLTFTFSFCDKDHPFIITVSLLGGGGYFTVTISPKGLEHLEASICVGAQVALNLLDIAQGSVSIMVGFTFTIDEGDVSFTAFLRLHGELDILGVVTISVDLNLSITYDFGTRTMIAAGSIAVDVSILFFSINVSLPFRKEFHACNNDPTLRELMPPDPTTNAPGVYWAEYVNAFA